MTEQISLLSDKQMWDFIVNGYVSVQTAFPAAFHANICQQAETIFTTTGNPSNEIYPKIPELGQLFADPAVHGALTSLLGPGYIMHPHRHCHLSPPGKAAQQEHKDSYEEDENVRHHRTRWAMAFYYPQDVTLEMGPSAIRPGSHVYNTEAAAKRHAELPLVAKAGTVTIIHYDLWHRAWANQSNRSRFMLKFLFCRMQEPQQPSWNAGRPGWVMPGHGAATPGHAGMWQQLWHWHSGQQAAANGFQPHNAETVAALLTALQAPAEPQRLDAAYALGAMGASALPALMAALTSEAAASRDANLSADYTNPSELYTGHALAAIGAPAVPALVEALHASEWWVRASAADILGNIGSPAQTATPALAATLAHDDSAWVRRNAAEALGTLGPLAQTATPALVQALQDQDERVRHNAALALARIGPAAKAAVSALQQALADENLYVRCNAAIALERLNV